MVEGWADRHLDQLGRVDWERLLRSELAVIGAGTLGAGIVQNAALLGIGQRIVDAGRVEPANVGTQALPAASVGEAKACVRASQVRELNPESRVEAIPAAVEALGFARLADVDLLVSALDSRRSRVHVNAISRAYGIPLLDLAVDGSGERLLGTVALYDPQLSDGACYVCRLASEDLAAVQQEGRPVGCPSWRDAGLPRTAPTLASPAFAAVVAGFASLWAVEVLRGRREELANRVLVAEAGPLRLRQLSLTRARRCLQPHEALAPLERSDADTLGALLERATDDLGGEPAGIVVHHRALALGLACPACGERRGIVRLAPALSDDEVRCRCGEEMAPLRLTDRLSASDAKPLADLGWRDLGVPEDDLLSAERGERTVHYLVNPREAASRRREALPA